MRHLCDMMGSLCENHIARALTGACGISRCSGSVLPLHRTCPVSSLMRCALVGYHLISTERSVKSDQIKVCFTILTHIP